MNASREQGLSRIRRAAAAVELRMRLSRVMRVLPFVLIGFVIVLALTLAARKLFFHRFSEARAWQVLIGAGALGLLTLIVAALRRLPPRAGSIALDKAHQLSDRLTNALAFSGVADAQRSPLMDVAIDDAVDHTKDLKPRKAAPIHFPWELLVAVLLAIPLVILALLEIRIAVPIATPVARTIDAPPMSPDDIELFKDAVRELEKQDQTPEMKAAIEKFNQLIEDLANKRLDRTEAFRRMEELERDLLKGAEADAKKLQEELKNTGIELSKSDLAKPIGDALQKHDLDKAKKEMQALAEKLKSGKMDKAALDRLKKAMEDAAKQRKEALAAINEKRQELRDEILKKKEEKKNKDPDAGTKNDEEEERLLKDKERQLEKLDREAEQQERAGRSLDRLDRDLAQAAADLAKELGLSAEDMQKAAEDINRMQQEQMSDKDKEELRKRLQELRELLRQQGQAGKERMKRMMKFGKRARGQSGQSGQGQGQQGQGQGQDGEDGEDGEDGNQGQGQQGQGQGQQGQGQGQGAGKGVTIGLGQGQGQGQGEMPGQGDGPGQGQGQGDGGNGDQPGGQGAGTGHNSSIKGDRTDLKHGTSATRAEAADTGQGPSNSEVILSAAERGFKGGPYKKVYKDYRTHAEQQINKDEIPDGYRFYVRRYFQLIRPRE